MSHSEKKGPQTRLAIAVPGALSAVLLVGAVAFGAHALRSGEATVADATQAPTAEAVAFGATVAGERRDAVAPDPKAEQAQPTDRVEPKPAEKAEPTEKAEPKKREAPKEKPAEPKKTEAPKEQPKPQPKPTEKPKPAPSNPGALALEGWAKDAKVKLAWKPYGGDGFDYYKVVRSADATVTWPTSGDDALVGAIGDPTATWWADKPACGTPWSYRVFAVRSTDAGYVTLAASNAVTVTTTCAPKPTQPPAPKALAFEVTVVPGEGVRLAWQPCECDGFVAYKVVRSLTNADPRYPLNAGTELIAAIGDPAQTQHLDADVAAGETWTYRVLAVADFGSGHVVIGETAAVAATAE